MIPNDQLANNNDNEIINRANQFNLDTERHRSFLKVKSCLDHRESAFDVRSVLVKHTRVLKSDFISPSVTYAFQQDKTDHNDPFRKRDAKLKQKPQRLKISKSSASNSDVPSYCESHRTPIYICCCEVQDMGQPPFKFSQKCVTYEPLVLSSHKDELKSTSLEYFEQENYHDSQSIQTIQTNQKSQESILITQKAKQLTQTSNVNDQQEEEKLDNKNSEIFVCDTCKRSPPLAKRYAKNYCQTCYKRLKQLSNINQQIKKEVKPHIGLPDEDEDENANIETVKKIALPLYEKMRNNPLLTYKQVIKEFYKKNPDQLIIISKKVLRKYLKLMGPPSERHQGREARTFTCCPNCKRPGSKHYAKGFCSICYRKMKKRKNT